MLALHEALGLDGYTSEAICLSLFLVLNTAHLLPSPFQDPLLHGGAFNRAPLQP